MEKTTMTTEAYVNSLAAKDQPTMRKLIALMTEVAPEISQTVWQGIFWGGSEQSILGFGDFQMTNAKKQTSEWFYIGMARQKNYISVYVNAVRCKQYLLQEYKGKLGKAKVGSANVTFTKIESVDLAALKELFTEAINIHR